MGIKRSLRPKIAAKAITDFQIGDLMDGRGNSFAEFFDATPVWVDEQQRRDFWDRFKGKVYQTMKDCQRLHKHPAAYYEYERFTADELAHDAVYLRGDFGKA